MKQGKPKINAGWDCMEKGANVLRTTQGGTKLRVILCRKGGGELRGVCRERPWVPVSEVPCFPSLFYRAGMTWGSALRKFWRHGNNFFFFCKHSSLRWLDMICFCESMPTFKMLCLSSFISQFSSWAIRDTQHCLRLWRTLCWFDTLTYYNMNTTLALSLQLHHVT